MLLRFALFAAVFFAAALTPKISANAGNPSGRALGELVLAEKRGIQHPDQVVDFDYSTDTSPFYVTAADVAVTQYQRLSGGKLAGGLRANEARRFRIVPGFAPSGRLTRPIQCVS
jgi:hypothetical protein